MRLTGEGKPESQHLKGTRKWRTQLIEIKKGDFFFDVSEQALNRLRFPKH